MNRIALILILLFSLVSFCPAQKIAEGPVWGAVTPHSVKVYVRPAVASAVKVVLYDSPQMALPIREYNSDEGSPTDHSHILYIDRLEPGKAYYATFYIANVADSVKGSFRTFPEEGERGDYVFVAGSCQETENMKVFDQIPKHQPWFMLHTGDFTYPDYQIRHDYSADYPTVAYSYQKRYDEKRMKEMLRDLPIDYIFDDNDYVGSSGGRYYKNSHKTLWPREGNKGRPKFEMDCHPFPAFWRSNVIRGYTEFFPHYELPDTSEGIYHSFRFANSEFFFLDRNSAKTHPQSDAFRFDSVRGRWYFEPPADYCLFCEKQMNWLKQGLKNSTADWKFIVSGVPFNQALKKVIATAMAHQYAHGKGYTGFHLATGLAYYFAGHPVEADDFYKFLKDENIRDVIVISGDTHHNVMDDGKNAGLPEMNASGLSVDETELAYYVNLVGKLTMGYNYHKGVWNQGGNGLGNSNFKNAFGKVRIHGNEYVELSIVDEDNQVLASFRVPHSK